MDGRPTFAADMKQFVVILLIGCISGQALVRTAWTLHYQWNKAFYLKNCENRAKPNLHCNGKCHLKKKIAASENSDPTAPHLPEGFRQIKEIPLYFESFDLLPCFRLVVFQAESFPLFAQSYPGDAPLAGIFKPPAA